MKPLPSVPKYNNIRMCCVYVAMATNLSYHWEVESLI